MSTVLRILDASSNRAAEGLRVVEDYVRFGLDDRHLTERVKLLRHRLGAAVQAIDPLGRRIARDTQGDVGVEVTTPSEAVRSDAWHVAAASFGRVKEALRSLEEYSKLLGGSLAGEFERLRYELYTLERAVDIARDAISRLADARLYVLVDGRATPEALREIVEALVAAQVDVIQLREKGLTDRELLKRAQVVRQGTRGTDTLFIMNDRADIAVATHADGVHVGQKELSVRDTRAVVGTRTLIGVSTHTIEQARQAVLDGANYLGVGPTFPSQTKLFAEFSGLDFVRAVASEISLPAFAIGGITLENVPQVLEAGIRRVAISSAIVAAKDPKAAAEKIRALLNK